MLGRAWRLSFGVHVPRSKSAAYGQTKWQHLSAWSNMCCMFNFCLQASSGVALASAAIGKRSQYAWSRHPLVLRTFNSRSRSFSVCCFCSLLRHTQAHPTFSHLLYNVKDRHGGRPGGGLPCSSRPLGATRVRRSHRGAGRCQAAAVRPVQAGDRREVHSSKAALLAAGSTPEMVSTVNQCWLGVLSYPLTAQPACMAGGCVQEPLAEAWGHASTRGHAAVHRDTHKRGPRLADRGKQQRAEAEAGRRRRARIQHNAGP